MALNVCLPSVRLAVFIEELLMYSPSSVNVRDALTLATSIALPVSASTTRQVIVVCSYGIILSVTSFRSPFSKKRLSSGQ